MQRSKTDLTKQTVARLVSMCVWFGLLGLFGAASSQAQETISRTWSDPTGKFQTTGELLKYDANQVELKKPNGNTIVVPLKKLCDADVKFINDLLDADAEKIKAAENAKAAMAAAADQAKIKAEAAKAEAAKAEAAKLEAAKLEAAKVEAAQAQMVKDNESKQSPSAIGKQNKSATGVSGVAVLQVSPLSDQIKKLPVSPEQQQTIVQQGLQPNDMQTVRRTLMDLQDAWPQNPTAELLTAVNRCLKFDDKTVRLVALRLLTHQDLPGNLDSIIDSMDDASFEIRWMAYECLGHFPAEVALDPLMTKFYGEDTSKIATIIEGFGSQAELKLIPLLNDPKKGIRLSACSLLAKVGSERCLPKIKSLSESDPELSVRYQAKNAINEIEARQSQSNSEATSPDK